MVEIPSDVIDRRDAFCQQRGIGFVELRGLGVDGFVWQTSEDNILKVFRYEREFQNEVAVYQRFQNYQIDMLQGFQIPNLIHYDEKLFVLELSYVKPPYILDFAAATLDHAPPGFDPDDPTWIAEKQRLLGNRWPEVVRLLDALRHLGIHYTDVHKKNILIEP